jgi:glycosyltransferase involved in cell wall biosynthesis
MPLLEAVPTTRLGAPATVEDKPVVEIVVPVYNEARVLEANVRTLLGYLGSEFPLATTVTIVDNASTDETWPLAEQLRARWSRVQTLRLDQKGRGRALRAAWSASRCPVVAYVDVDLSTDLHALLPLVAPLLSGHSDLAVGSRLAPGARVVRGAKRELISRSYNAIVRAALHTRFTDAQCGFKALRGDVARALLPLVENDNWFFDTELLVQAERHGLRIHEVSVDWVEDPDSSVDLAATAIEDLRGVWRLRRHLGGRRPKLVSRRVTSAARLAGGGRWQ